MEFARYPAYKASGVDWLGAVPAHWTIQRLRRIAMVNPPKAEAQLLPPDTEVSFLPMEAIGDDGTIDLDRTRPISEVTNGYTYFRNGDVAIAKITPCFENGKGAVMHDLIGGIGFGTTELIVARPDTTKVTSSYLDRIFNSRLFRQLGEGAMYGAGGQKRVPDDFVRNFVIGTPPLEEQTAIAAFLDRETARIAALVAEQRRLIGLLREKRQATITRAVTRGLDPGAPLKDSGVDWLGQVPAHWDTCQLRRIIVSIEQGWSPQCHAYEVENGGWGVLKTGCVNGGTFNPSENKALPGELTPEPAYEVRAGDVLMSRASGSPELVGSTALVMETRQHLMLSDKIFRLHLDESVTAPFFVAAMNSAVLRAQIENALSGGNGLANNLPQASLKSFFITLPPPEEQTAIAAFLDRETARIAALIAEAERSIALLQERRAALISAAVTGQIDVRGTAPALAAA